MDTLASRDPVRVTLAVSFVAGLSLTSFWVLQPFLPAALWAVTIVIARRSQQRRGPLQLPGGRLVRARHVHRQEPCRSCWARYLCGGGCHHEVISRGRPACDYIRGWLHYCLEAYLRLSSEPGTPGLDLPGTAHG